MNNVQANATQPAVYEDLSDAADAILNRWSDGEDLSDDEELEATDEDLEETSEETSDTFEDEEETEEDEEDTDEDPDTDDDTEDEDELEADEEDDETEVELSDDALVEIQIDGEIKQASLKDLKRLYGQEASLTRKSQEVAAKRKEAEDALSKAHVSYQTLLERAEARFKPYSELDMILASRQMSTEDFAALRKEAQDAEADLKFLKEEADAFYKHAQAQHQKQIQEQAKECIKVLEAELPDWGNELYNDIRTYAVNQGLPQEQVDQYTDPVVIMLLNKARLYDQTKASAQSKKEKARVIKSKDSTRRVLKSKKAPANDMDLKKAKAKKARENLRTSQDQDDITSALLARWER
jgi:hypothetical protein